jgi:hypothetical protein
MISIDNITRDLLPATDTHADEIGGSETVFAGSFVRGAELPLSNIAPAATQSGLELPPASQAETPEITGSQSLFGVGSTLALEEPHSGHPYPAMRSAVDPMPYNEEDLRRDQSSDGPHGAVPTTSLATSIEAPSTGHEDGGSEDPADRSDIRQIPPGREQAGVGAGHYPTGLDQKPAEFDDVHSIDVRQIAIVDQEASVKINGYVGEVVASLHIAQDLLIDQDETISFTIDGEGRFALLLDQSTHIDQEVEIDLEIFDIDGVLYVELFLHDSIKIEQDTALDMSLTDGQPGGTVEVNQDLELEQELDIDIDIEDELKERYDVDVTVETGQQVAVEQYAALAIKCYDGSLGLDVEAAQIAAVEQLSIIQADFNLT